VERDTEMAGATRGELTVTVTVGCAPSISRVCPPQPILEVAAAVHVVMPGVAGARAAKVNTTLSPVTIDAPPVMAVRFMALVERE
jgi:hypothetical protein